MKMGTDSDSQQEASCLKTIAETKFKHSSLKSALKYAKKAHRLSPNLEGLSSMVTAFQILGVASKSSSNVTKDWYKIFQVEPFSHINSIKKQYKNLALILHPDKNPHLGCEEAFKLVGEGFRVLSDKLRRKEYDMRLRIEIQDEKVNELVEKDAFWTACSRCRLLHQFERKYLGHSLVCPSCKKSFEAVEVVESNGDKVFRSERRNKRVDSVDLSPKIAGVGLKRKVGTRYTNTKESGSSCGHLGKEVGGGGDWSGGRLRNGRLRGLRYRTSSVGEVLARSKPKQLEDPEFLVVLKPKRVKAGEETMTLAEMQLEAKIRANQEKLKLKLKQKKKSDKKDEAKAKETEHKKGKETERHKASKNKNLETEGIQAAKKSGDQEIERRVVLKKSVDSVIGKGGALKKSANLEIVRRGSSKKSGTLMMERRKTSKTEDLEMMAVEDSDFYDFDRDRVERSFKKGQIWAIYDDDDGMPRHYGLIDEVVSVSPFEVKINWLDLQNNGDEELLCWEKMGFHISCGRFKVSRKTSIDSLNIFSHVVECERAAREVSWIYPKKGSVWALYNEVALGVEGRNLSARDRRSYDIVVFLTTYSEMRGLSMAYLEKVDGFKTVFKRGEIGCHAIRWLEKDEIRLFSHQIPAKKFNGDEVPDHLKDCWELDPASLPSDLLTIGWES